MIANASTRATVPGADRVGHVVAGRVHLLYGLAGSGKTTLARVLCADGKAVRFTLDEWMIRLYPGLPFESAEYARQTETVKDLIWSLAEQVLRSDRDVVLDWNSWSRSQPSTVSASM